MIQRIDVLPVPSADVQIGLLRAMLDEGRAAGARS